MNYLLFFFYLAAAIWIVPKIPFVKNAGLTTKTIIVLFLVRLSAGIVAVWLPSYFSLPNDYSSLQHEGLIEFNILRTNPKVFFGDIFQSKYNGGYDGFFSATNSFWNDLRTVLVIKIIAVCNLFSRGFIFTNTLFFNMLGILGPVAFYRLFNDMFPNRKKAVLIGSFLLPSTIFFSSGMHKDLIIFTFLGLLLFAVYFVVKDKHSSKRLLLILISLLIILLMRNFLFIALIPASASLLVCIRFKKTSPLKIFILVYASLLLLFYIITLLLPSTESLRIISQRQQDFMQLDTAASQLPVNTLEPTIGSFILNLPQALNHGFVRPYIWDKGGRFTPFWATELAVYILLSLFALAAGNFRSLLKNKWLLFFIFFCFTIFLLTGYIVPNSSSIVRYKSVCLPLIITPVLIVIEGFVFRKSQKL